MYLPFGLIVALTVLIVDQVSKWWLLTHYQLSLHAPVELLPFVNLVEVYNSGISFGMLSQFGMSSATWLIAVAIFITTALCVWLSKVEHVFLARAIGLVIGGAVANIVDRYRFGAVFDFIDVHAAGWHWPAFNVADSAICIGVILMVVDGLCRKET